MIQKRKLSKRTVDAAKPPTDSQSFTTLWDSDISGFGLRITKSEVKSYILQYRINNRQRKYTIGRHGVLTPDQARKIATELRAEITKGNDPQGVKHQKSTIPTLEQFSHEYMSHAKQTKKTWEKDQSQLNKRVLPALGQCRLDTLTTRQVETLHNGIKAERTPATANRHLSLIKRMLNLAIQWGYITDNPAMRVKSFKENNERMTWLDKEQILALLSACQDYPEPYAARLFPFLLYTGARLGEALAAQWEAIDLKRGMWHIPEAKSGKGRYVPLSEEVKILLEQMPRDEENSFVFCGKIKGNALVNVNKPWKRIKTQANLPPDFRIHDLRHTFASWGVSNGIDLYHIQSLLGHASLQMTQRYAHLAEEGIKASVNQIGKVMNK